MNRRRSNRSLPLFVPFSPVIAGKPLIQCAWVCGSAFGQPSSWSFGPGTRLSFHGLVLAHACAKTKRHPRALSQLEAAMPELSPGERDEVLSAMWDNLGRTFAEGMLLDRLLKEPDRVVVEDETLAAKLQQPTEAGLGTIFVSLHSGNWEALGVPLAERGLRVAALYQAVQNPMLERYLLAQREKLYRAGMISKGSHAMKRIVRLLRSGDAVAMLADHRQARRGIMVPFFGQDAPSTPCPRPWHCAPAPGSSSRAAGALDRCVLPSICTKSRSHKPMTTTRTLNRSPAQFRHSLKPGSASVRRNGCGRIADGPERFASQTKKRQLTARPKRGWPLCGAACHGWPTVSLHRHVL